MDVSFPSFLNLLQPLASASMIMGALVVLVALVWLVFTERGHNKPELRQADEIRGPRSASWNWLIPLGIIVAVGAILRILGIDEKSLSHPEIYIPGIPLPAGISEPPPRLDLFTLIPFHLFNEPHPVGYYLAMFGWTKLFGTSVLALRLPSALIGILSIPVVYRLGTLLYDRKVGLISAGFLALHGLHIHWSQQARMYVPECFLGLVATWLLFEIPRARRHRLALEAAYVMAIVAGYFTEWFIWPLVGAHVLFTLLQFRDSWERLYRMLYFQILSMILGATTLSHALTAHAASGSRPSLADLRDFLSFGFLYEPDFFSQPMRVWPMWAILVGLILSIGLLARGLSLRPTVTSINETLRPPERGPLLLAAIGMSALMAGLALLSPERIRLLLPISVFPLLTMIAFPLVRAVRPHLCSQFGLLQARLPKVSAMLTSPLLIFSMAPVSMVFLASFVKPMVARRAFLVFVPYLLILIAVGASKIGKKKLLAVPVAAAVVSLFLASAWHFHTMPASARDYSGLASAINARLQPDDLIFVPNRSWSITPLFYYVDASSLVATDYTGSLVGRPHARVWIVFLGDDPPKKLVAALDDFRVREKVEARGARGILYER